MATVWISGASGLVQLEPGQYLKEIELQRFIAEHPEVLASAVQPEEKEPRWLLIRQELNIVVDDGVEKISWSLDHLFIDGHGKPTLVEVKRSTDPRARREVVGQLLDYAASFKATWTAATLRDLWQKNTSQPDAAMNDFLESTDIEDAETFWGLVDTKINANELRLMFVADRLSTPVVRIIEYLNEQVKTTEVIGVEVLPHKNPNDLNVTAYVPTVRGRTTAVPASKGASERRTQADFDQMLSSRHGEPALVGALAFVEHAEQIGGFRTIGSDARNPRLYLNFKPAGGGKTFWPFAIYPSPGRVALQLRWLSHNPAFEDEDTRSEFVSRCSEAIGQPIDAPRLDGFPGFDVQVLTKPGVVDRLTEALRWCLSISNGYVAPSSDVSGASEPAAGDAP